MQYSLPENDSFIQSHSFVRLCQRGRYQQVEVSVALMGLPMGLLEQILIQLGQGMSNSVAAQEFAQAIQAL